MKKAILLLCIVFLISSSLLAYANQWLLTKEQINQVLSWAEEDYKIGVSRRLSLWTSEGPEETFYIETPAFALYRIAILFYKKGMALPKTEVDKITKEYSSVLNVYVLCYGRFKDFVNDCSLTLLLKDSTSTELKKLYPIYKDVIYVASNFPDYPAYKALIKFVFDTKYIPRNSVIRFDFIGDKSSSLSDFIDLSQIP